MFKLIAIISGVLLIASCGTQSTETKTDEVVLSAPNPKINPLKDRVLAAQAVNRSYKRVDLSSGKKLVQGVLDEQKRLEELAAKEAAQKAAEKAQPAPTPTQAPQGRSTGNLPPLLLLIRSHESGGNYSAYNGSGCEGYGCGGAFQLHAKYASVWAERAGFSGLSSNAANWPPATQDAVALNLFYSTNPDGAHWCNWTAYC